MGWSLLDPPHESVSSSAALTAAFLFPQKSLRNMTWLNDVMEQRTRKPQLFSPFSGKDKSPWGPGGIYHEKQVGSLCALHCVNNLLQDWCLRNRHSALFLGFFVSHTPLCFMKFIERVLVELFGQKPAYDDSFFRMIAMDTWSQSHVRRRCVEGKEFVEICIRVENGSNVSAPRILKQKISEQRTDTQNKTWGGPLDNS